MATSLYQVSIPAFQKTLGSLKAILKKGEDYATEKKVDPSVLLTARLFPTMFALTRQVQIACDGAKGAAARLSGREIPKFEDTEATFADLYARIDKTLAFIASIPASEIDGQDDRAISLTAGGTPYNFKAGAYLVHWAFPNFFFHVTTAYAILRHNGVDVGKLDYLGQF